MSAPRRFRKRPVVIEALHYDGSFPLDFLTAGAQVRSAGDGTAAIVIETLEGGMRAEVGDWIIKGVAGEFYPCKPDIFAATYEPVDQPVCVMCLSTTGGCCEFCPDPERVQA